MLRCRAAGVILLLLISSFVFAEDQNREVLADLSPESVPVLNDILNNIRDNISGKFVDLNTNQTVGGLKTFSLFPLTPSSPPSSNYQVSNKKYVDDSIGGISTTGLSNIIYCWTGNDWFVPATVGGTHKVGLKNSLISNEDDTVTGGGYIYFESADSNDYNVLKSKFIKIAGINTLTIYARSHTMSAGASFYGNVVVTVGSASGNVNIPDNSPYGWFSFTINVSGLTNNSVYDLDVNLKSINGGIVFLSAVIIFGS